MDKIRKGTFVTTYVGEVITHALAEERGKKYNALNRTYLFELDFHRHDPNMKSIFSTSGSGEDFQQSSLPSSDRPNVFVIDAFP